jgi:hypothetical protein
VAADIATSAPARASGTSSSPKRRNVGTNSPIIGASRLPVGAPSTAQQNLSASTTSGPYFGAGTARSTTIRGVDAPANALRA